MMNTVKFTQHVSKHTFQNAVSELRKAERKKEDRKKGIEEEELKKAQNGR
jgi:hypothetical protein